MGHRFLRITPEILIGILKGFGSGPLRYFDVVKDALPKDVVIKSIYKDGQYPNGYITIILESTEWVGTQTKEISPVFRSVELPADSCNMVG